VVAAVLAQDPAGQSACEPRESHRCEELRRKTEMTDDLSKNFQPRIGEAFNVAPASLKEALEEWARGPRSNHLNDAIVSYGRTRHLVGPQSGTLHVGRVSTLCGMGLHPDEGPFEPLRDCDFCIEAARNVMQPASLKNISLDDLSWEGSDSTPISDRELFIATVPTIVQLAAFGAADPQSAVNIMTAEQPGVIAKFGAHHVERMARLILKAEIPRLSAAFAGIYREFNQKYFGAQLPEYSVHVVIDLHEFDNEPIDFDSDFGITNGLIRVGERSIYVRYTWRHSMEETLIHEMAHAATNAAHGEEWLAEMRRLKEAGAPVAAWELE
jgi:hypothetical protein